MALIEAVFEAFQEDEQLMNQYFNGMDQLKAEQKREIREIIESYLSEELADEDGMIPPDALDPETIEGLEQELLDQYAPNRQDDLFNAQLKIVNNRIQTANRWMERLNLTGIPSNQLQEMPLVTQEIERVSDSFVLARNGDGDHPGAVRQIEDDIARFRFKTENGIDANLTRLKNTLAKHADIQANYTHHVATTGLAGIDRRVKKVQSSEAGIQYAKYVGPFDDLTRPFCRLYLNRAATWNFWDQMFNFMREGLFDFPVAKWCGGINCRHRLIPWMPGWDTEGETIVIEEPLDRDWRNTASQIQGDSGENE